MTKRPKIAAPVGRAVKEWIGKTPDSKPPPSVELRIFERADGICHITKRKIRPGEQWHVEHIIALADGGENRESNLAPALVDAHDRKTAAENKRRNKAKRQARTHRGLKGAPTREIPQRDFPLSKKQVRKLKRPKKLPLPPRRSLYQDI